MSTLLKTKEVADQIGVNTRTILRWVHQFQVESKKNEQGHYLFTEESLQQFRLIKEQLDTSPTTTNLSEQRLEKIEALLAQKADDIVYIQILQQRTELEEISAQYQHLVERVNQLESTLNHLSALPLSSSLEPSVINTLSRTTNKQHWLRKMFSF